MDFFAGSGTTFHATCLLNAADGGNRRTILVTNNEVDDKSAKAMNAKGLFRGDAEFESHGIFAQATRPRCEAVVNGTLAGGKKIAGAHVGGRPFANGFEENVEFFRLDYLDPDEVDLGNQFESIYPSLWLAAGGVGARVSSSKKVDMLLPKGQKFGILFQEERFRKFSQELEGRPEITHVWIVTDSEDAFAEVRSAMPARVNVSMLYRDYLRTFKINTRQSI